MASPSKKISAVLASVRQESASGHYFINYHDLQNVVSQELVEDSLESFYQPEHQRATAVREVLEKGLRVFSILIWIQQEDLLAHFFEHDELDDRLPMEESQVRRVNEHISERFWNEVQWEHLPHTFKRTEHHTFLYDRRILPFIKEVKLSEGGFGEIYKSTIASSQQSLLSSKVLLQAPFLNPIADSAYGTTGTG